ncbi:hypothetical protein M2352_002707 [Azospirillum fermentarium]|uniref:LamG domain-containing protein n=1 Tax=Azospirillum fermentarium TaxID=1233114 RepID=UPI002226D231|nr:LamG domain-containing protein [Azospirillum fermentarium]MCW2247116.1 hypothetical protein [Azospirillum fermentarium]
MLILNALTGFGATAPTGTDPYFTSTVLLIQPSVTDTVIADLSPARRTVTVNGAPSLSSSAPWSGGRSIAFDGNNWLSCADSDDFHMPGDYVIESVFLPSSLPSYLPIVTQDAAGSDLGFSIYTYPEDGHRLYYTQYHSSGFNRVTTTTPAAVGTWMHLTIVKSGSLLSIYCNGTREAEITTASAMRNGAGVVLIGASTSGGTYRFYGAIAGIRITKGTSRGLSGATIPVPAAPWPTTA